MVKIAIYTKLRHPFIFLYYFKRALRNGGTTLVPYKHFCILQVITLGREYMLYFEGLETKHVRIQMLANSEYTREILLWGIP